MIEIETLFGVVFVASENLVVGNPAAWIHRYHGAVHMGVQLVKVYIETDDVIFAPVFTCKPVHVLRPTLYVLVATDMRVVRPVREVHSLVAEGELVHPLPRTAEDDVGYSAEPRLGESLVGILDATGLQGFRHALPDRLGLIHGHNFPALDYFKVEPFAGAVIIAVPRRPFPTSFRPVALVLVALAIAHALSGPDVKYLFDAFCHIIRSFFTACCRPRRFLHFAPLRAKCVLGYAGRACLRGQALSSGSEVKPSVNTPPVSRDTMHLV